MDSQSQKPSIGTEKRSHNALLRYSFALVFALFGILLLLFAAGFFALVFGDLSINSSISVASQCRIVSSSVDLRSSKVCELGVLNFRAKHVFHPAERRKFRCRFDYYWASVFKVEYKDQFSGQTLLGVAEAPTEALPRDCRPDFGTALWAKQKFKVNESYDCWYSSGVTRVEIFQDIYFGCQAKEPSTIDMFRRYLLLSSRMLQTWISDHRTGRGVRDGMMAGAASGFFTSLISIGILKVLQSALSGLPRIGPVVLVTLVRRMVLSRAFFFIAYFSVVGWLAIQYGKRLGLPVSFADY